MALGVDCMIANGSVLVGDRLVDAAIGISDGRIVGLGSPLSFSPRETVDATGLLVLPGIVDPHVHLASVFSEDDFDTGSQAAAFGGVTTMIDFTFQEPDKLPSDAFREKTEAARKQSYVDFTFHCAVTQENLETIEDIRRLCREGLTNSFKFFMAYDFGVSNGFIYESLKALGEVGGTGLIHAEDPSAINYYLKDFKERGCSHPRFFPQAHPHYSEETAIATALILAREARARLYFVHVTTGAGADLIRKARGMGIQALGETCPHYLTLTDEEYERTHAQGIMCPPLRRRDDNEALWGAVTDGTLQAIGTDHAAFRSSTKAPGNDRFWLSPFGAAGLETMLSVLYSEGVGKGRMSLGQLMHLLARAPARLFSCPTKGEIAVGKDADLVLFDPGRKVTITAGNQHSISDYTLYEGWQTQGQPVSTLVRGEFVVREGELTGAGGYGRPAPRR